MAARLKTAVPPSDLRLYHRNPRRGNVEVIMGSLARNGQYRPLVVNIGTHTGRPNEVLAGNHTLMAIRKLAEEHPADKRWAAALVHWLDVDDDQAARIVVADNKTADMGGYDDEELASLLSTLPDLEGTGYTDKELAKLLADNVVEGDAETDDTPVTYGVVIDCDSEAQQVSLLDKLEAEGLRVRALM